MFSSQQEEMLANFRRFLSEMSKEELQQRIEKIKQMNFTGQSVDEYFDNFHKGLIFTEQYNEINNNEPKD
jgi:uncharacterized protein YukE